MTDRELMQQALDAMLNFPNDISDEMFEAMKVLKARLAQPDLITPADVEQLARIEKLIDKIDPYEAQPEPEPQETIDKWIKANTEHREWYICPKCSYQAPRFKDEWQGLTTQEIADETDITTSSNKDIFDLRKAFWCGARWAEEKLKEKNHD